MNMNLWGCVIDEDVKSWILFMIDDEFFVKIIDEIATDYDEISVVYDNDYANMNHCQIRFWINRFW